MLGRIQVNNLNLIQGELPSVENYFLFVGRGAGTNEGALVTMTQETDPLTNRVLPVLEDKKNHVIDALRYACEGVRRAIASKPTNAAPLPMANRW